ncbi:MAG: hypothetical protein K0S34_101 [Bacillales bacterium]|jgi:hypothetical protein|nr:hypothetical protein [Bacillales bacterium]
MVEVNKVQIEKDFKNKMRIDTPGKKFQVLQGERSTGEGNSEKTFLVFFT